MSHQSAQTEEWTLRKIQTHGDGYKRINIPKTYGDDWEKEKVEYKEIDDYLVVRPPEKHTEISVIELTSDREAARLNLPGDKSAFLIELKPDSNDSKTFKFLDKSTITEGLVEATLEVDAPDEFTHIEDQALMKSLIVQLLQSYWMAGADKICIPEDELQKLAHEDEWKGLRITAEDAIESAEMPPALIWDEENRVFEVKDTDGTPIRDEGDPYSALVDATTDFMSTFFRGVLTGEIEYRTNVDLSGDEGIVDNYWALTGRSSIQDLLSLKVDEYPDKMAKMHFAKYCEMCVDHIRDWYELFDLFEDIVQDEDIVDAVRNELNKIFFSEESGKHMSYDDQLESISKTSFRDERPVSVDVVKEQIQAYEGRKEKLEDLWKQLTKHLDESLTDEEVESVSQTAFVVGKLATKSEQIARIPRSMAITAFGFRYLSQALES